ncbi:MAG: aminotransferase class IV [Pseudonocardia sp.]
MSKHLDRLAHDFWEIFGIGLDRSEVREYLKHAIAGRDGSFVARVTVFDPDADLSRPGMVEFPSILITTRPAGRMSASPMTVQSVTYRRDVAEVKHVGLFGALRCRRSAQLNGFDDALLIDNSSFVYAGATWNVGFFDGDRVVWRQRPGPARGAWTQLVRAPPGMIMMESDPWSDVRGKWE